MDDAPVFYGLKKKTLEKNLKLNRNYLGCSWTAYSTSFPFSFDLYGAISVAKIPKSWTIFHIFYERNENSLSLARGILNFAAKLSVEMAIDK